MRTTSLVLLSLLTSCASFSAVPSLPNRHITTSLQMTVKAPIVITGDNIDLTPALTDYVNQKIERTLGKLPTAVSHCDVYLTVNKNPKVSGGPSHITMCPCSQKLTLSSLSFICCVLPQVENAHTAEVVTTLKGTTFRVAEDSPDMYASIDLVANRLVSK